MKYTPVPPAVARQHIAGIIAWLESDQTITEAERAEFEAKLAAPREPRQAGLDLRGSQA